MNSNPANKVTEEQKNALFVLSKVAYDAAVAQRGEMAAGKPGLASSLSQQPHPQSLCGCGCQEYVCGYYCFSTQGCGCSSYLYISSNLTTIGPTQSQGMPAHFNGSANGPMNAGINLSDVYMSGVFPDVNSVVNHTLPFNLEISSGAVTMTFYDQGRVLGGMHSLPGHYYNGYFHGSGTGTFTLA
jgi:hypothetical protein